MLRNRLNRWYLEAKLRDWGFHYTMAKQWVGLDTTCSVRLDLDVVYVSKYVWPSWGLVDTATLTYGEALNVVEERVSTHRVLS